MGKAFSRPALFTSVVASLLVLLALAFLLVQLSLPYDGARLEPGSLALREGALLVTPLESRPGGMQAGDLVIAIEGRGVDEWAEDSFRFSRASPDWAIGDRISYTIQRGEQILEIPVEMGAYPIADILMNNWGTLSFGPLYLLIGAFVFLRRPHLPAARVLFLASSAMFSATTWSLGLQANSFAFSSSVWLYHLSTIFSYLLVFVAGLHFVLLFPRPFDGLLRRRWLIPLIYLLPYTYQVFSFPIARNQSSTLLGALGLWSVRVDWPVSIYLALTVLLWIVQYRRNQTASTRAQLRWPLFAILLVGVVSLPGYFVPPLLGNAPIDSNWIGLLGIMLPISIAIAILRHNLFDIDTVLNRTLLYTMLTVVVAAFYGLSVGALSLGVQSSSTWAAALLTMGFLVFIFRPLQAQLQLAADRLVPQSSAGDQEVPSPRTLAVDVPPRPTAESAEPAKAASPSPTPGRRLALMAWYPVAFLAVVILILSLPGYISLLPEGPHTARFVVQLTPLNLALNVLFVILSVGASVLSILLAWLLYRRRKTERIALFLAYFLLAHAVLTAGALENLEYLIPGVGRFSVYMLQPSFMMPLSFFLFAVFPDGRFVPPWTRWMVLASFAIGPVTALMMSQMGIVGMGAYYPVAITAWLGLSVSMLYAQIYRYRRVSSQEQKQQTKWFVFGIVLWFALMAISSIGWVQLESAPTGSLLPWWAPLGTLIWVLSTVALPLALTVAVMRFRLYEIDLIINRALVYGGLTATIVLLYVLIVGALGGLFQTSGSLLISLIGTGLVAILLNPLRVQLQAWVDRWLYGQRDNPTAVLDRLHRGFESTSDPDSLLQTIAQIITETLKLPFAAFEMSISGRRVATSSGQPAYSPVKIPLLYQGEEIGHMLVGPRGPDEPLSDSDEKILQQIAVQTTAAIRAMYLAQDLQEVRAGLVATREEERRRLRRDLHDGLGPVLASQGLKMAAVRQLLEKDPQAARELVEEVVSQNENTVAEIRRLVYGLRPPALDEFGLEGALMDFASDLSRPKGEASRLDIKIRVPDGGLPPLPAAVEVAAYRIATEALTNVARHADAGKCEIKLGVGEANDAKEMQLEVIDDGKGIPSNQPSGVGLGSMRERAQEIGGTLEIRSALGSGTRLIAKLPLIYKGA